MTGRTGQSLSPPFPVTMCVLEANKQRRQKALSSLLSANIEVQYTVNKGYRFSRPQPCSPWTGKNKLFPSRESLVSDIPAGDGKTANLFFQFSSQRGFPRKYSTEICRADTRFCIFDLKMLILFIINLVRFLACAWKRY